MLGLIFGERRTINIVRPKGFQVSQNTFINKPPNNKYMLLYCK